MGVDERSNYRGSSHSFTEWWLLVVGVLRVTVNLTEKGLVLRTPVERVFVLHRVAPEPHEGAIAFVQIPRILKEWVVSSDIIFVSFIILSCCS